MTAAAAGWFPDPMRRHQHRYWDGSAWTAHVANNGVAATDPVSTGGRQQDQRQAHPEGATPVARASATTASQSGGGVSASATGHEPVKVNALNAKRVATALQDENARLLAENARLRGVVDKYGVADAALRESRLDDQRRAIAELDARAVALRHEADSLNSQVIVNRDRVALEEVGLFDFEHPAEASASLGSELEAVRSQIRQTNKIGQAITATSNFTFNNSAAKGRTFVNQMSRIMLRAYNAEAENAVKSVKAGNLAAAQQRLSKAREQIAKQGVMIDLSVTGHYHHLRLRELDLAARHLQALAADREMERERRAELREQKLLETELKKEKERLEKERSHYLNSIERMRNAGDFEGATALQAELDRVDAEIEQADYRAANIRAGYVYVISNIGAFGEGVVKIGLTRRLDPMDRIRELGDASVPFVFDVHALFFSDDAVSIEAMLHREFSDRRLNKVNPRKEFFRVDPQAVLDVLTQHKVAVLEFTTHASADQFRMSWPDVAAS